MTHSQAQTEENRTSGIRVHDSCLCRIPCNACQVLSLEHSNWSSKTFTERSQLVVDREQCSKPCLNIVSCMMYKQFLSSESRSSCGRLVDTTATRTESNDRLDLTKLAAGHNQNLSTLAVVLSRRSRHRAHIVVPSVHPADPVSSTLQCVRNATVWTWFLLPMRGCRHPPLEVARAVTA